MCFNIEEPQKGDIIPLLITHRGSLKKKKGIVDYPISHFVPIG